MISISETLNDRHRLAIDPNKRHDLFIGDKKISGSASRIIRTGLMASNESYVLCPENYPIGGWICITSNLTKP